VGTLQARRRHAGREKGKAVTDQQINEAIALACGWIYYDGWHHPDGRNELPNYCADLNAMHEAEKTLKDVAFYDSKVRYVHEILCITVWSGKYPVGHRVSDADIRNALCFATARQRAEAFLRTIGKWKEESK
jgi:hypothetical protein